MDGEVDRNSRELWVIDAEVREYIKQNGLVYNELAES